MKKIEEIKDWLIENAVDKEGNLNLSNLDFSNFDGDVKIGGMKVKKDLYQNNHEINGSLFQSNHRVNGEINQQHQTSNGTIFQYSQTAEKSIYTQKVAKGEIEKIGSYFIEISKKRKMTKEDIQEILGYEFDLVENK